MVCLARQGFVEQRAATLTLRFRKDAIVASKSSGAE